MSLIARDLPSVDAVLQEAVVRELLQQYDHHFVVDLVRQILANWRDQILQGGLGTEPTELLQQVALQVRAGITAAEQPRLRQVVNATGVILHSGLGRAPLPAAAREALATVAQGYCNLEIDLDRGDRGSRLDHVEGMICQLGGAEAALVVNNNAAAVLLALNSLSRGREVLVSRGELIEIGGSFRIPEIITSSGARIREVGTTNRTHLDDYATALNQDTGMILVVHPSNYQVKGFTANVELEDLVALGRKAQIPVVHDLGGGVLVDLKTWGLPAEPVVADSLAAGVDLVTFSGDKILGGPQSGLIAGSRSRVEQLKIDPLMRALRCDKLTLSALESSLRLFFMAPEKLADLHPVLKMMSTPADTVKTRGERLVGILSPTTAKLMNLHLEGSLAQVGGGALPLAEIPSYALRLSPDFCSVEELARLLRTGAPPVVGRIQQDRLYLDMRTVSDEQLSLVANSLEAIAAEQR
jgi:L-seryl-tRNA(Ser) seleniumtransferase